MLCESILLTSQNRFVAITIILLVGQEFYNRFDAKNVRVFNCDNDEGSFLSPFSYLLSSCYR
ncbi:hypothetical protein C7W93_20515 [Glaciimonas sp. PCH181]|nr:hypothetical protein C7W93_20515 [Glaciimonas sp. PCH181]